MPAGEPSRRLMAVRAVTRRTVAPHAQDILTTAMKMTGGDESALGRKLFLMRVGERPALPPRRRATTLPRARAQPRSRDLLAWPLPLLRACAVIHGLDRGILTLDEENKAKFLVLAVG